MKPTVLTNVKKELNYAHYTYESADVQPSGEEEIDLELSNEDDDARESDQSIDPT
jgi:hypothetical protein